MSNASRQSNLVTILLGAWPTKPLELDCSGLDTVTVDCGVFPNPLANKNWSVFSDWQALLCLVIVDSHYYPCGVGWGADFRQSRQSSTFRRSLTIAFSPRRGQPGSNAARPCVPCFMISAMDDDGRRPRILVVAGLPKPARSQ